jgi:surfeit locus 1 family protein
MTFKPSLAATLLLAALAVLFALLGNWQLQRAADKEAAEAAHAAAGAVRVTRLDGTLEAFTRVELRGRLDPERHFLIDNRILAGRPGVHVLTPFMPENGQSTILVNRGWLPLPPDRASLPEVPTPTAAFTVTGELRPYPGVGVQLGEADQPRPDQWPQLITYPDREAFGAAIGEDLRPWVVYMDKASAGGFEGRDWRVNVMGPGKHRAYAVQWFALAATAVGAWIVLGARRAGGRST